MFRSRSWFGSGLWKPKNPHSLEQLKHLYNVLSKNQVVSDSNRSLLVETLRAITEILIWGDQNDSTVFDFFLEKNMLSFFLKIMKQKCGSYVCVQLLQTLNILFENIRNETSLYYLLSNNHVNSIIVHKFDFSDEEVMAYYISFLKTLSLKLNSHTIHFFYNEHTNDFPLYTEAIKFFNNSESMVRIAVRTLTLNVYRVQDDSMLSFIRDKTAAPYFTNLVWFIGNHVLELNSCLRENAQFESQSKLADLVAEHLDHLHYINDILLLEIDDLNKVLSDHLVLHLLVPLYVCSLCPLHSPETTSSAKVSGVLALFLLSQVFLILTHPPLVRTLAGIIFNGTEELLQFGDDKTQPQYVNEQGQILPSKSDSASNAANTGIAEVNTEGLLHHRNVICDSDTSERARPVLDSIMCSLIAKENDYSALFALCLLHATLDNTGLKSAEEFQISSQCDNDEKVTELETSTALRTSFRWVPADLTRELLNRLVSIISEAVGIDGRIRIVTLNLVKTLLAKASSRKSSIQMDDSHVSAIVRAHTENINVLQHYFKTDELFLENFEAEYEDFQDSQKISVENLLMDSQLLLPPVVSPLSGIAFDKRLPCGEVEKSRRAIKVYFVLRSLLLTLKGEAEKLLPLAKPENIIKVEDSLDLSNSDIQSCIIVQKDNTKLRRFLVIDVFQFILVEPSLKKMGWGVVKFVGWLQDVEVLGDKDDPRCLHITVKNTASRKNCPTRVPLLSSKFIFDDHIRCMAAKQRLLKGKLRARQRKLHAIAKLLNCISTSVSPEDSRRHLSRTSAKNDRTLYNPIGKTLPGLAMAVVQSSDKGNVNGKKNKARQIGKEEIPLECIERPLEMNAQDPHDDVKGQTYLHKRPEHLVVEPTRSLTSQSSSQNMEYYCTPDSTTTPQSETSFVADPSTLVSTKGEVKPSNADSAEGHSRGADTDVNRAIQIV